MTADHTPLSDREFSDSEQVPYGFLAAVVPETVTEDLLGHVENGEWKEADEICEKIQSTLQVYSKLAGSLPLLKMISRGAVEGLTTAFGEYVKHFSHFDAPWKALAHIENLPAASVSDMHRFGGSLLQLPEHEALKLVRAGTSSPPSSDRITQTDDKAQGSQKEETEPDEQNKTVADTERALNWKTQFQVAFSKPHNSPGNRLADRLLSMAERQTPHWERISDVLRKREGGCDFDSSHALTRITLTMSDPEEALQ